MAQKFVGIDLGNRKVKVAVVTAGLRGAQVMHVWEQEVRASSSRGGGGAGAQVDPLDAAIDTALRMLDERGLRHLPTGVALPGGSGSYRVLSFPFDDPRQIAQAISFELDGQFPVPIEELATDHLPIKLGDGRGRALVVAAKRATIEHVSARLQLADIDLKLITTGALAIAQALASTPVPGLRAGAAPGLQPASLIVDFGHKSTELVALGNDGPIAARSMRRGGRQLLRELSKAWGLDMAAATIALERDGNTEDPRVRQALQPLLREIEHTRQWVKSEFACEIVELRLSGGVARLRGLDRWLATETGLEVGVVAPKESGALRQVQGRDWTGSLIALGTAVATGRRPLIQLHDAFDTGGGEGAWFQQHFSTVAALGVAILAFATVDSMVRVKAAERELDAYTAELEHETRTVFGVALDNSGAVRTKLGEAEGGDVNGQIPERGALEVLELVTKAATPKVAASASAIDGGQLPPGFTTGVGSDGSTTIIGPDGGVLPLDPSGNPVFPADVVYPGGPPGGLLGGPPGGEGEGETEGAVEAGPSPVTDSNAGILADDQLLLASVEIRNLKIELNLSATRATAQDRLGVRLRQYGCIRGITKGMIKDRNGRQSFEMSVDHNCFTGSVALQGATDDGEG
ncbi:General secretion pathway protein L [Enhygromyxa salina]|uniref:General secretion pathway protein L n=1 Tax=Enhygromyxa salina TaxID=215803 RepID=A0A0C1ZM21_9BACT|nr:pilus assembly protein PilM [Enhygromyxa salina]KIG18544.1 General secretion pathway protein L [Enhygromyxa salina]